MAHTCISDEVLAAWVGASLSAEQVSEVEGHLACCTTCRVVLSELVRTTEERPTAGVLGRYVLQEKVGAGGMGTVYAAWDPTLGRKVAVKILHEHQDIGQRARRFAQEREILGGLEHANIARLLDAGETPEGRPFFVIEFVDGDPIDQFCERRRLSTRQRLELMNPVFSAVSYAHQHLVVHRDLKPGNILVTHQGIPKLVDFGIARLLDIDSPLTVTGMTLMTPAFASPEQVRREPVATTSDVYSLGVVLYELLTGVGPYAIATGNVEALLQAIREGELGPCSVALARASEVAVATRAASRERLRRELFGDVDAIVAMALRKEPTDRYPSVQALQSDVQAWLEGRPTVARKSSSFYRATKLVRRHKTLVAAVVAAFLALAAGLVATLWQARRAERQRDLAERRFEQVRTLAHAVLFDYHDGVAALPGSTHMRERLVKDGLQYLDSLLADVSDDPALRRELAQAYLKVGDVQGDPFGASLGDTVAARASYLKGRELAQAVLAVAPGDVVARRVFASSFDKIGAIFEVSGELRSALDQYQQGRALDAALAADRPDNLDQRFTLSRDDLAAGQVLVQLGELEPAAVRLEQSLAAREAIVRLRQDTVTRRGVAVVHIALSDVRNNQGRLKEAIIHAEEAERQMMALLAEHPESADLRRVTSTASSKLVNLYVLDGQGPRALEAAQRPLVQARKDLALDPKNSVARRDLVVALASLASAQGPSNLKVEGAATLQEALRVQRPLIEEDPENLQNRRDLCHLLAASAEVELSLKNWRQAEAGFRAMHDEARALLARDPDNIAVDESVLDAHAGLASTFLGRGLFEAAIAENRLALAAADAFLSRNPTLGRVRNRRATWVSREGEIRLAQALAAPGKRAWQLAQEAQRNALEAFARLEKAGELSGSAADERKQTLARLKRCDLELQQ